MKHKACISGCSNRRCIGHRVHVGLILSRDIGNGRCNAYTGGFILACVKMWVYCSCEDNAKTSLVNTMVDRAKHITTDAWQ